METAKSQPKGKTLRPFVETLAAGDPIGRLNLTLVPLRGEGPGQLEYILAADAITGGQLTVTEVSEGGSVPELLAVNQSEQLVLLLDGEELVGAKQNRILNTTVLLPEKSKTNIPVSCVEQGRWHHVSRQFSSGSYSPSRLRAVKNRNVGRNLRAEGRAHSDQGAVWQEVADCMVAACAPSPTSSMHDVVEQRQESLGAYIEALAYSKDARGIVAAVDGVFVALDLFDKAGTLERIWSRLVTGYALDAICSRGSKKTPALTAKGTMALLEHLGELDCQPCPTVGLGEDWRFEAEDVLGQALVVGDVCVHLSAFPCDDQAIRRSSGPRIVSPSQRRGRRQPPPGPIL